MDKATGTATMLASSDPNPLGGQGSATRRARAVSHPTTPVASGPHAPMFEPALVEPRGGSGRIDSKLVEGIRLHQEYCLDPIHLNILRPERAPFVPQQVRSAIWRPPQDDQTQFDPGLLVIARPSHTSACRAP